MVQRKRGRDIERHEPWINVPQASTSSQHSHGTATDNESGCPSDLQLNDFLDSSMLTLPIHGHELGRLPIYLRQDLDIAGPHATPPFIPGTSVVVGAPTDSYSQITTGHSHVYPPQATGFPIGGPPSSEGVPLAQPPSHSGSTSAVPLVHPGDLPSSSTIEQDMLEMWSTAPVGFE